MHRCFPENFAKFLVRTHFFNKLKNDFQKMKAKKIRL